MRHARPNPILLGLLILSLIALALWPLTQLADERADNERLQAELAQLQEQNRGPQGPDGDPGRAPTTEEIAAAVEAYCAAHDSCRGTAGARGATGSAGVSIGSVVCNGTSISFFSTTGKHLGSVKQVCIN